jgi:hypothetical protein
MKTLNRTKILLKSNLYIKYFCQPECCQYKILTKSFAFIFPRFAYLVLMFPKPEHSKHWGPFGSFFSASFSVAVWGAFFSLPENFFLNLLFFINCSKFLANIATASSSISESSSEETLVFFLDALRAMIFAFLTGRKDYSYV